MVFCLDALLGKFLERRSRDLFRLDGRVPDTSLSRLVDAGRLPDSPESSESNSVSWKILRWKSWTSNPHSSPRPAAEISAVRIDPVTPVFVSVWEAGEVPLTESTATVINSMVEQAVPHGPVNGYGRCHLP